MKPHMNHDQKFNHNKPKVGNFRSRGLRSYFEYRDLGIAEASNGIEVFFNGELLATMSADGVGLSTTEFTKYTFTVTGTGSDRVEFRAVGTADTFGGLIDDVRLTIS